MKNNPQSKITMENKELINKELRYPYIFNAMDIPKEKMYI